MKSILCSHERFAVLTTVDALDKDYIRTQQGLQCIRVCRPIRFLSGTSPQSPSPHVVLDRADSAYHYAWVTRGLKLPDITLWSWRPDIIFGSDGTRAWHIHKDRTTFIQKSRSPHMGGVQALVAVPKPPTASEARAATISRLLHSRSHEDSSEGFLMLADLVTDYSKGICPLSTACLDKLATSAYSHVKNGQISNNPCPVCTSTIQDTTGIPLCTAKVAQLCGTLLQLTRLPSSLRTSTLQQSQRLLERYPDSRSVFDLLYKGVCQQSVRPPEAEKKSWHAAKKVLAVLFSCQFYKSAWTYAVQVATQDGQGLQPRVRTNLEAELSRCSKHIGEDARLALERQQFFLKVQSSLNLKDKVKTAHPSRPVDIWSPDECRSDEPPGNKRSFLCWNVNGLKRRWKSQTFQDTIARSGYPDQLYLTETRCSGSSAKQLRGFNDWLRSHGYNHVAFHWSTDPSKGGAGYGGVCIISKQTPTKTAFGMEGGVLPFEARVSTSYFPEYTVVNTYVPNSGGRDNPRSLPERLAFDVAIREHIQSVTQSTGNKPVFWVGDLNVTPTSDDHHRAAFKVIPRGRTGPYTEKGFSPSASPEERLSYSDTLRHTGLVNVWNALKGPSDRSSYTWFPQKGLLARRRGLGARLDHIHAPLSILDKSGPFQVEKIENLLWLGDSDHTPLLLTMNTNVTAAPADAARQDMDYTRVQAMAPEKLCDYGDDSSRVFTCTAEAIFSSEHTTPPCWEEEPVQQPKAASRPVFQADPSLALFQESEQVEQEPSNDASSYTDRRFRRSFDPLAASADTVVDSPPKVELPDVSPMPFAKLHLRSGSGPSKEVTALLDTGSLHDLVSVPTAISLTGCGEEELRTRYGGDGLPTLLSANGTRNKALAAFRVTISSDGQAISTRVVYVFGGLPVDMIVGSLTFKHLSACLDYETGRWRVSNENGTRINIPFVTEDCSPWQASTLIRTAKRMVIPARSHAFLLTRPDRKVDVGGDQLGILSPLNPSPYLKVAWGLHEQGDWLQIGNVSPSDTVIPKGTIVAALHCHAKPWYEVHKERDLDLWSVKEHRIQALLTPELKSLCLAQMGKATSNFEPPEHRGVSEDTLNESLSKSGGAANKNAFEQTGVSEDTLNEPVPLAVYKAWCARVAEMSDEDIEKELRKSPLDEVDLSAPSQYLDKTSMNKLKRWVVRRKYTFSDGTFVPRVPKHPAVLRIDTLVENPILRSYPYRMNPNDCDAIRKQIDEWKANGVIRDSVSPWSSNIVLVRKADKKARVAIDYRKLNSVTRKDAYMLPRVDHVFDVMNGMEFVSVTDCHSAFLQIPILDQRTRELTAFVAPDGGLYEFLRCPFGLVNAPSVWQRLIDTVMAGYKWKFVLTYVDDLAIFTKSKDIGKHLEHLDLVFDRLDANGLAVKASKTFLAQREIAYLGHVVSTEGIKPDPKKVKAIVEMPVPKDQKSLRSAMGLFSYYRKFVKFFSKIAAPLTILMSQDQRQRPKNEPFLNAEALSSFNELKKALSSSPICLSHPDWSAPFEVHTDACKVGVSAVLCQQTPQGERVVMYASRSTTPMERKYHAHELEALAVVWACEVFRHYLYGRKFVIRTDHQALKWLMERDHGTRVMRWVMRLQELDFDIIHRAGTSSGNADGLSRNPLPSVRPYGEQPVEPLYDSQPAFVAGEAPSKPSAMMWQKPLFCSSLLDPGPVFVSTRSQRAVPQPPPRGGPVPAPSPASGQPDAPQAIPSDRTTGVDSGGEQQTAQTRDAQSDDMSVVHGLVDSYLSAADKRAWLDGIFKDHQQRDPSVRKLVDGSERAGGGSKTFFLKEGVVYMKALSEVKGVSRLRRVVPRSLVGFVLYLHHNLLMCGHQGSARTTKATSRNFYWRGMSKDCKRWVKACVPCKRRKTPRPLRVGLTQPMYKARPMHTVAIDLVGPCPDTRNGDVWILTMIDVFTRWPIAVPLPNRNADTVMKALYEHLICDHSMPRRILSDRGKEFIDAGLVKLCSWLGVAKVSTTGYQPQANGHVERFHRYMNAALTILCRQDVSRWDWYLPAVLFTYRTGACESTGYSPYRLLYGRHPDLPIDHLLDVDREWYESERACAKAVAEALYQSHEYARVKQRQAAARNCERRDANRREPDISVGSTVFYWMDKSSEKTGLPADDPTRATVPSKWRNWWHGPYSVVSKQSPNVFVLRKEDGTEFPANANRITPYHAWDDTQRDAPLHDWVHLAGAGSPSDGPPIAESLRRSPSSIGVGDMVAFPMSPSEECPRVFGVGKVLSIENNRLNLQWYGNLHERHVSTYRPCWYQRSLRKFYYKNAPLHTSHPPYTTNDTKTVVTKESVVVHGFAIGHDDKLSDACLRAIASHPKVVGFDYTS